MKITIAAVGKIKEKYLAHGIDEYLKRLRPYARVSILTVLEEKMPENPSPGEKAQVLLREGERLLQLAPENSLLLLLDVGGEELSSEKLAQKIATFALSGNSNLTFLIGGPFGLGENLREAATLRISLSQMTFTHQMTRLILLEQIYRAFKINRGEKYHW